MELFQKFSEIFRAKGDTGGKRKKSSSRKFLIILFGHLWVYIVELICRYNFSFKFSLILLQLFATGVVDTSSKFAGGVVDTGGKFTTVVDTVVYLDLQISQQVFRGLGEDDS